MAFEFKLSTDETREKMFNFIKPFYNNTYDFEVDGINWCYGVYDSECGFFITYVNLKNGDAKYILITGNGDAFYVVADRYWHKIFEIPEELEKQRDLIQDGIKLYNNEKQRKVFESSFSAEQEKVLNEIAENMKDKCRPGMDINCYEDAEKLFIRKNGNYHYISHMYNKCTVANFDKYMSDEKMRMIRGEIYRTILSKISSYNDTLSEEDYKQISNDFLKADYLITNIMDNIYADMTFEAIKKAYFCGVNSCGYVGFIKNYMKICIQCFPDKIQELRPLLDFINENVKDKTFRSLEFYRKELEKLIYNRDQGFHFVCTTNDIREKMFDFLKPEYKSKNDLDVTGINWTTGIYDKESGIFLSQIYYVSDGIARCGVHYHSYIVITDNGDIFKVINNDEYEKKTYDFRIPAQYEKLTDKIKEGIDFYRFSYEYRKSLSEDTCQMLQTIDDVMDDRCHRNFTINCEEDARRLFELENCSIYAISGIYNKKTINDFNKFADEDKILLWRGDRYSELLKKITYRMITKQKRCQYFRNACCLFICGVNDTYDKQFLKAVKCMYNKQIMGCNEEDSLRNYLNAYDKTYSDKLKNLIPLIELIEAHSENKYLKDVVSCRAAAKTADNTRAARVSN